MVTDLKTSSKISVFIICKNEERIIESCLKQAQKLANEIIIVDSGSTDSTLEICQRYTSPENIYHQDWLGFGKQKNFALSKCSNEWVLSLDADEVLSDELITEIQSLQLPVLSSDQSFSLNPNAFLLARKLFIGSQEVRFGGFYPDRQLRLFRKSRGRFCSSPVHESVELMDQNGAYNKDRSELAKLKSPILHYGYESLDHLQTSFNKYAALSLRKKNKIKAFFSAIYIFIYKYIVRLGFLDGILGLRLALINASYNFKKYF